MRLIAGLGNPGVEYKKTRHNIGFMVVDELATRWSIDMHSKKHHARFGKGCIASDSAIMLKPETFMNLSGTSIADVINFYKIEPQEVVVIVDDLDLPLGQIRLRQKGTPGGHNGLKDINQKLGHGDYPRLKIGIDRPLFGDSLSHVLGKFTDEERQVIDVAVKKAADAIENWINDGIQLAMNKFNNQ